MYSYYGLSVIPALKDKLWWKKYLTMLQLVNQLKNDVEFSRFFLDSIRSRLLSYDIRIGIRLRLSIMVKIKSFEEKKTIVYLSVRGQWLLSIYMIIMLVLFRNYYVHEYVTKSNNLKRSKEF